MKLWVDVQGDEAKVVPQFCIFQTNSVYIDHRPSAGANQHSTAAIIFTSRWDSGMDKAFLVELIVGFLVSISLSGSHSQEH